MINLFKYKKLNLIIVSFLFVITALVTIFLRIPMSDSIVIPAVLGGKEYNCIVEKKSQTLMCGSVLGSDVVYTVKNPITGLWETTILLE